MNGCTWTGSLVYEWTSFNLRNFSANHTASNFAPTNDMIMSSKYFNDSWVVVKRVVYQCVHRETFGVNWSFLLSFSWRFQTMLSFCPESKGFVVDCLYPSTARSKISTFLFSMLTSEVTFSSLCWSWTWLSLSCAAFPQVSSCWELPQCEVNLNCWCSWEWTWSSVMNVKSTLLQLALKQLYHVNNDEWGDDSSSLWDAQYNEVTKESMDCKQHSQTAGPEASSAAHGACYRAEMDKNGRTATTFDSIYSYYSYRCVAGFECPSFRNDKIAPSHPRQKYLVWGFSNILGICTWKCQPPSEQAGQARGKGCSRLSRASKQTEQESFVEGTIMAWWLFMTAVWKWPIVVPHRVLLIYWQCSGGKLWMSL